MNAYVYDVKKLVIPLKDIHLIEARKSDRNPLRGIKKMYQHLKTSDGVWKTILRMKEKCSASDSRALL